MSKGRGKCSDGVILKGVLDLLGVKMGEVFSISFPKERRVMKGFRFVCDRGLMVRVCGSEVKANGSILERLLLGEVRIKR